MFVCVLMLACPVFAVDDFVAAGVSWNQYAAPQISGNLLYAHRLKDQVYTFNFVDLVSKSYQPFTVATSITTGVGAKILEMGPAKVFATTGVGVLAGDKDVGYSWTSGWAATIPIGKKGWAVMPNVRVIKSSLTEIQWIGGVMIGWGR